MPLVRSSPSELGYAQITSNVTQAAGGNQDVEGLSVTVNVGSRPIMIRIGIQQLSNATSNGVGSLAIKEDTTQLAALALSNVSVAGLILPGVYRDVRLTPSPGTHTYKVNLASVIGTTTLTAGATSPAYIHVLEV